LKRTSAYALFEQIIGFWLALILKACTKEQAFIIFVDNQKSLPII
jgi:hypothetical protein